MNPIDECLENLDRASAALAEAEASGDEAARLNASLYVEECERRLLKLQIDGPYF